MIGGNLLTLDIVTPKIWAERHASPTLELLDAGARSPHQLFKPPVKPRSKALSDKHLLLKRLLHTRTQIRNLPTNGSLLDPFHTLPIQSNPTVVHAAQYCMPTPFILDFIDRLALIPTRFPSLGSSTWTSLCIRRLCQSIPDPSLAICTAECHLFRSTRRPMPRRFAKLPGHSFLPGRHVRQPQKQRHETTASSAPVSRPLRRRYHHPRRRHPWHVSSPFLVTLSIPTPPSTADT